MQSLLAGIAIVFLCAVWVMVRVRLFGWARDTQLTDVVQQTVADQLSRRTGKHLRPAWLSVMRVDSERAMYALRLDSGEHRVMARAKATRREDGSVAIETSLLGLKEV
jgi:hypothetical protein